MADYRLSRAAEADILDILVWSQQQFGEAARLRYERLIMAALIDVASDPLRPGSIVRPELGPEVRSWHLRGSRERARHTDGAVLRPRHFLIYRSVDPALIIIGRLLHDAMELGRHMNGDALWE